MKPIISKNSRIRHPELFKMGDYSVLDDYCYISTQVKTGIFCHIAAGCVIAGGKEEKFEAGSFGGLAAGVKIFCASDNFKEDIGSVLHEYTYVKNNIIRGGVKLANYVTIGANSVVMPNNNIPEGVCIGANSFVPSGFKFEAWSIYAGQRLKLVSRRNRENVLKQGKKVLDALPHNMA